MTVFETNNAIEAAFSKDIYAIYLRKSRSDDPDETVEETLEKHRRILTDLAARQGLFVGKIYAEVVSGAESVDARPQIQQLIKDCYAGMYRGIIIKEVTRLSRGSQGDAQKIMDCLKYSRMNQGLLVITPTKKYDIAHNSDDEEYMEFELFMSRREYKMINRRMQSGKDQCIVDGEYMASYRPYGWDIIRIGKKRTLTPKTDEYEIVKLIYKWRLEGEKPFTISKRLTLMGVPTYTGETKEWSDATVKEVLRNPVNMGKVRWNDRMQVKVMADGNLKTTRPRSNHTEHYMLYDGIHKKDAVVTEEEWNRANGNYRADKTKANLKLTNPLAGLLLCQKCGRMMVYQAYNKKPTTSPRFLHKSVHLCKVKSALAEDVLKAVAHSLRLYIEDFELKINGMPTVNEDAVSIQIETLKKEMKKIQRKLDKLFDDYEEEIYSANEFVERKAKHNERMAAIREQIAALEDAIPEKEEYEDKVMKLTDALNALEDDTIDAEEKNRYLKEIVNKIEFSRENGEEFILDVYLK